MTWSYHSYFTTDMDNNIYDIFYIFVHRFRVGVKNINLGLFQEISQTEDLIILKVHKILP